MSFKEFVRWCNERACDGCWGMSAAITCIGIMHEVEKNLFGKEKNIGKRNLKVMY